MATGTINFVASVEGLELEEIEISCPHPSVKRILIKTQEDKKLLIAFELLDVFSENDALSIVKELVNPISSRISYELNVPIGEARYTGASLPTDITGSHHKVMGELVLVNDILSSSLKPGKKRREKLKRNLELPATEIDLYLSLYRFCLRQKDPLAHFLSLYHLIHIIASDERETQLSVDKAIANVDPNVEWTVKPNTRGKQRETRYTRLRNEIVHRRLGKTLQKTREEIEENVDGLRVIAKKILSNMLIDCFCNPGF